ncbi:Vacuolar protein sorting-associated protein 53 [Malassezia cuniculi]|uniref:Vacuolar protein sorting-associated protein 53 n=1 Tax=Malassezia cuniculi TaxID=948313 RepID=A0AAF0F1J0_9BASI|nr:Vacuolar protein sorting-associated protein 53 [Malassezia cuniculi]
MAASPDALRAHARAAGAREPAQSPLEAVNALLGDGCISAARVAAAENVVCAQIAQNITKVNSLRNAMEAAHSRDAHATLADVDTLLTRLATLQAHVRAAESYVSEITSEIRGLDTAKRNIASTIVALRRLQMLVSSVYQLEQLCADSQFKEAASALQAVEALLAFFEPHSAIQVVVQLRQHVLELRKRLATMATAAYDGVFSGSRWTAQGTQLAEAALVVDALGPETRTRLVDKYCTAQLREYRRVFRAADEAGQLDNVPRRYAWFRRVLRQFTDEHADAFLPDWRVDCQLLARFADITREDLKSVLIRTQPTLTVDALLAALHASVEFEQQVARQYGLQFDALVARELGTSEAPSISSVFVPYLGVFVDAQDKRLAEMVASFAQAAVHGSAGDEPISVLVSSTELFQFYRHTLEKCAQLSAQAPLRELADVFAKWLQRYASDVLQPALNTRTGDAAEVHRLCVVLNTADYCITTAQQLEGRLAEKLPEGPPTLGAERDTFSGIIAAALQALTRALSLASENAFGALVRPERPWTQLETLVDRSPWVDQLASALETVGAVVREEIDNKRYVRSWCDRAALFTSTRIVQCILRLRPIRARTAGQLLSDVGHVRTALLELPRRDTLGGGDAPAHAYERHVERNIGRIEPVLRILAEVPDEAPAPARVVEAYLDAAGDQSLSNFQKVFDLRGIRRPDQAPFIEEFLAAVDRTPNLPTTSALSALDLDPASDSYALTDLVGRSDDSEPLQSTLAGLVTATSGVLPRPSTPTGAARALPDWKKFGSMFGVALGRERRQ